MTLFVLYMHRVSSYLAFSQVDCHLQIGCYQTYAIGSCVERLTRKVDVRIVRVWYPIPNREGSQRASTGGSHCRKDQYWYSSTLRARMGHVLRRIGLWRWMWHRYPACIASGGDIFFFNQITYRLHQQSGRIWSGMLETEVALITHLNMDLYLGTPTNSVVDSFIISNYLVPFGPFW
jgi:hypothetical protein